MIKKLILVLILVLLPNAALAGEYDLVKGKGVEICEAYKKDLESLNIPDSMMCQIWMWGNSKYEFSKDFKRIIWKKLDLKKKKNRELYRHYLNYSSGSKHYNNDRILDVAIETRNDRGQESDLYTISIDLDNDGKKENVLLYRRGFCPDPEVFLAKLFILTADSTRIDTNHPIQKLLDKEIEMILHGPKPNRAVHVFIYKNRAYIGKYCGDRGSEIEKQLAYSRSKGKPDDAKNYDRSGCREDNTLSVYKISNGVIDEVCKYRYKNN